MRPPHAPIRRSSSKSSKTDADPPIAIGTISKVHGVGGAFVVALDPSMKQSIAPGSVLRIRLPSAPGADPAACEFRTLTVAEVSAHGPGLRVLAEDVSDRDEAERLIGAIVSVDRASLPALGESEYYDVDIIGARVLTDTGTEVGTLTEIFTTGANDVYIVSLGPAMRTKPNAGKEVLIPAVAGSVISVDTKAGCIVVDHRVIDQG